MHRMMILSISSISRLSHYVVNTSLFDGSCCCPSAQREIYIYIQVLFDEQIVETVTSLPAEIRKKIQELSHEGFFCNPNDKEIANGW